MSETLKLPEKTRVTLRELYRAQIAAVEKFQLVMGAALDFLGLDPNVNYPINFDTGEIQTTPTPDPDNVTPIKADEATG